MRKAISISSPTIRSHLGLVSLCFATCTTVAHASEADPSPYVGLTAGGQITAPDRVTSGEAQTLVTTAQISNEDDVLIANFALDFTLNGGSTQVTRGAVNFTSTHLLNVAVKASVPINPAEDGSQIDFRSFGNDGKLTIGFNYYRSRLISAFETLPENTKSAAICVQKAGDIWLGDRPGRHITSDKLQINAYLEAFKAAGAEGKPAGAILFESLSLSSAPDFRAFAHKYCKIDGEAGVMNGSDYTRLFGEASLGAEGYARWNRRYNNPQGSWFLGAEASLGYSRFDVVDRPAGQANLILLASAGYTRRYKAQDVVQVCGPPDSSGNANCISGQDGPPTPSDTGYATLSARYVLHRNSTGDPVIGIRPSVTYILGDKDWQFELPVYLQRNEDGGLDAGIRAIYNTGARKFGLGAFVGVPF
jgi:hypothetical protein